MHLKRPNRPPNPSGARCPHPACPGCPLFALPYDQQLAAKQQQVAEAFGRYFDAPVAPAPTKPSSRVLGYRATAKLVFARSGKTALLGVYQRNSHDVVDVPRCPVHHPLIAAGVRALRELLAKAPHFLSSSVGGQGWLRYAALQASLLEQTLVVGLVTSSAEGGGVLRSLAGRLAEKLPGLAGVSWNVNASPGNVLFGERWETVWGNDTLRERLGDVVVRASPGSFLQANREQAGWVYRNAAPWLQPAPSDRVLDLYAGVGGLSLHLAPSVAAVVAVEGSNGACRDGARAAHDLGLSHVRFEPGRVEHVLPQLLFNGFHPTLATLNPPRRGALPAVLDALRQLQPRAILYVSCHPETLARDAAALCSGGLYRLALLQPVDFFPLTQHVETAALLNRRD